MGGIDGMKNENMHQTGDSLRLLLSTLSIYVRARTEMQAWDAVI